ncbi:MAG: ribonuclease H-like domain-containing protein [Armatimonadota bacterium]
MSTPRDYLKRLEAMNGGPLRERPAEVDVEAIRRTLRRPAVETAEPIRSLRGLPRPVMPTPTFIPSHDHVLLEEAVDGAAVHVPERGEAYLITRALQSLEDDFTLVREEFCRAFTDKSGLCARIARTCAHADWAPEDLIFVDLETTGLGHSPLFLIGAMTLEGDDLVVRQYLARHYGEESAVTQLFLEHAREKRLLVSFNGKSFDYPYLRARAAANAVPWSLKLEHFDLLHESRRAWRHKLPNCRLQTLEQCICGRPPRHGDIPGARIPDAYHEFVRTANAAELVRIIRHNMLDLITLAELMSRLPPIET